MANGDCIQNFRAGPMTRPQYRAGSYLSATDLEVQQNYLLQQGRRHHRQMHGWGVVCGLHVVPGREVARPWAVMVCPGYAIGPYGDEIELRERAAIDIREYLWSRPNTQENRFARAAYVVVRYRDQPDHLRPVPAASCECEDPEYAPSRVVDGYELGILWTPPSRPEQADLCLGSVPCPVCPDSPWLHLARVLLPAGTGVAITAAMIDNGIRRNL